VGIEDEDIGIEVTPARASSSKLRLGRLNYIEDVISLEDNVYLEDKEDNLPPRAFNLERLIK